MNYLTAAHTDVGIKRSVNQDSALLETAVTDYGQIVLGVVCDGMGGLEKGEAASAILVKAFSNWFHREFPEILYKGMDVHILRDSWTSFILKQNHRIQEYGLNRNISLGTTVTALLLSDGMYYILNIGDSRVYCFKDGIRQITIDHTFVQREIDMGRMTQQEAKIHPKRHMLLRCVGTGAVPEPDFYVGEYEKNSVFMICSDGFRHVIEPGEFSEKIRAEAMITEEKMKETAVYFTELNKVRGEEDNISVILIRAY